MREDETQDELILALADCKTPEDVQRALQNHFKKKKDVVFTRVIVVTCKCSLCKTERRALQKVEVTENVVSHQHKVATCFSCREKLATLEVEELVEMLVNAVRFGNARPETIQAKRGSYDYKELRSAGIAKEELAEKTPDGKTKEEE